MNDLDAAIAATSDWMVNYQRNVSSYPVLSQVSPGEVLAKLPRAPNDEAEPFEQIMADFESIIVPGITHWQHPRFFGYFPSNSSPPSVVAEMLIAALGVQGMTWTTSPAATELEIRVMEWLRDMFGLPDAFSGVIQDSASSATMIAMLTARERATAFNSNVKGVGQPNLVAYCSAEAHSSVEKAARIIGIGSDNLRKVPVRGDQAIDVPALVALIEADKRAGLRPFFVVGAFGTTGTTAIDDLDDIARVAQQHGLWFHVDAAYAGAALILPEMRKLASGIGSADSIVVNPHKWLLTTFDCSAFFVRDVSALTRTLSIQPEYLRTHMGNAVTDFRDWGLGLGRRFRSLKLWFVVKWYGTEGLQRLLRQHIELAKMFEGWVDAHADFQLITERKFNLVCFRMRAGDDENEQLLTRLNASGQMFLTHTKVDGTYVLRMVIGQTHVAAGDVRAAWELIEQEMSQIRKES